jgi:hypothetical protein
MKILAIGTDVEGVKWENMEDLLEQEAKHVFQLYLSDNLREIYFTENRNAVLILETPDRDAAKQLLDGLPLVKNQKIKFEILELRPYTGLERIIKK